MSALNTKEYHMKKEKSVYYIRTGNKVTQPFTIPVWFKLLVAVFACYFVWITVEFVKVYYLIPELIKVESDALAKYEMAERIEALGPEFPEIESRADMIDKLLKKELANERPSYR